MMQPRCLCRLLFTLLFCTLLQHCSSFSSIRGWELARRTTVLSYCRAGRGSRSHRHAPAFGLHMLWAEPQGQDDGESKREGDRTGRKTSSSSSLAESLLGKVRESHQRQAQASSGAGLLGALQGAPRNNLLEQIMTTTDKDKRAVEEVEQLVGACRKIDCREKPHCVVVACQCAPCPY